MIKSLYRRNLNSTKLIIEEEQQYQEDFQMRMIQENKIAGLLKFHGIGIEGFSQYHYDITGKVSMKALYEKARITHTELTCFLKQLSAVLDRLKNFLLDADCLLLKPEYIFYAKGQFYFCYLPVQEEEMCKEFHALTEFIVSQSDYQDKEAVFMAYQIHKASMEENYSMEQLLELSSFSEPEEYKEEPEEIAESIDYEEEVGMGLKSSRWRNPLRFFEGIKNNRKKKKWGEWEEPDDL